MCSWRLLWSDEFTGTSLNTNKWEAQLGDGGQFGIPVRVVPNVLQRAWCRV
jgi:hypothetical protein